MYNHQLDAFLKAAEMGSFGKAANAMFISTPALIQQINLLEEKCQCRLFLRSNHGVSLTPEGISLYEDAKNIIKLSETALEKLRLISQKSNSTVRIGTSLLFKCRLFPDIWSKISGLCPDLKIEILPLAENREGNGFFPGFGIEYDVIEGVYGSIAHKEICQYVALKDTPICCAVSKDHPLSSFPRIMLSDLKKETLVMPREGISKELDNLRHDLAAEIPEIKIIDSPYYGVDTFALCEVNPYVLITQGVYADIHPNLVTIPLNLPYQMSYGLLYAKNPSPATAAFIHSILTTIKEAHKV